MCWSVQHCLQLSREDIMPVFGAAHPSFLVKGPFAECAHGPTCLILARDDDALEDLQAYLASESQFKERNVFMRIADPGHGFFGARGPKSDATPDGRRQLQRIQEAAERFGEFFRANL